MPQAGQNVPRIPNPLQGQLPQLPSAGQGDPTPTQAPLSRPTSTPPVQEQPVQHRVDIPTGFLKQSETDVTLPGIGLDFEL